eukprot:4999498-Pleurochrysis_carterae.AAC.4
MCTHTQTNRAETCQCLGLRGCTCALDADLLSKEAVARVSTFGRERRDSGAAAAHGSRVLKLDLTVGVGRERPWRVRERRQRAIAVRRRLCGRVGGGVDERDLSVGGVRGQIVRVDRDLLGDVVRGVRLADPEALVFDTGVFKLWVGQLPCLLEEVVPVLAKAGERGPGE